MNMQAGPAHGTPAPADESVPPLPPAPPSPGHQPDGPSRETAKPVKFSARAQRVRAALDRRPDQDGGTMLEGQMQVLDALFRQLVLENAEGGATYHEMQGLSLALRAQAQCRSIWQGFDLADYRTEKLRRNRRPDY